MAKCETSIPSCFTSIHDPHEAHPLSSGIQPKWCDPARGTGMKTGNFEEIAALLTVEVCYMVHVATPLPSGAAHKGRKSSCGLLSLYLDHCNPFRPPGYSASLKPSMGTSNRPCEPRQPLGCETRRNQRFAGTTTMPVQTDKFLRGSKLNVQERPLPILNERPLESALLLSYPLRILSAAHVRDDCYLWCRALTISPSKASSSTGVVAESLQASTS
jgi:hypothetical protein